MKEFLAKIGQFFSGLFNAAQRTWNKLPADVRSAITGGSTVISFINQNIDLPVDELSQKLQEQFSIASLENLTKLAQGYNLQFTEGDYESVVGAIQSHLKPLVGKTWATISDGLSKFLAALASPEGVKYAVISSLMEFAYQRYVKPR